MDNDLIGIENRIRQNHRTFSAGGVFRKVLSRHVSVEGKTADIGGIKNGKKKSVSAERRIHFTIQSWHGYKRMSSVRNMMCCSTRMAKRLRTRCFFITLGDIVTEDLLLENQRRSPMKRQKKI